MGDLPKRAPTTLAPISPPETGWPALVALALTTIFAISVAVAAWVYYASAPGVDFASFWAAGHLALAGDAGLAYDIDTHAAVERTVANIGGALPFSYPPPFLFFVAPFAFRPFWLAYLLWMAVTCALYFISTRALFPPRYAFAHPAAVVNAIIGQNGFFTTSLLLLGTAVLAHSPFAGGAILGLLVVKPQLAILVPVALLASRDWRALTGAAVTALSMLALAAAAFGLEIYGQFLSSTREFAGYMADGRWKWSEFASVFGFARHLGIGQTFALALQAIAAIWAAFVTWQAWAEQRNDRIAVLAAATMLVSPYLLTYDSLLLIVPLACLLGNEARRWRGAVVWILLLLPLGSYVGLYPGPNTIPLAAILSLLWLQSSAVPQVRREGTAPVKAHGA